MLSSITTLKPFHRPPFVASGGGTYDPGADAAVVSWFKADGVVYTTGTTQATDGQSVTTFVANTGPNAVQNTSGNRPLFKTNQQNSLPGIYADGTDDFMQTANFAGGALSHPYVVYTVAKHRGDTNNNYLLDGNDDAHRLSFYYRGANGNFTVYGQDNEVGIGSADTNTHIFRLKINGASGTYKIDGSTETTFSATPGSDTLDGLTLFGYNGGGNYGDWILFELIVRNNASDDIAAVLSYLNAKWVVY